MGRGVSEYLNDSVMNVGWMGTQFLSPSWIGSKSGHETAGSSAVNKPLNQGQKGFLASRMGAKFAHRTVLLDEVVDAIGPAPGDVIVDCTLGGGGHSERLLERLGPTGRLIAIDRDPQALKAARERLADFGDRFVAVEGCFSDIRTHLDALGLKRIDGLVADLGVSSHQLDTAERGFSFRRSGPVDMRMGNDSGESAADFIARVDLDELAVVLGKYGDVPRPYRVARAILASQPYADTTELADVIAQAMPKKKHSKTHPATRAFQAIRIAVNDELGELEQLLAGMPEVLAPGARVAIISFHSLEDRMVKRQFFSWAGVGGEKDAYGNLIAPPLAFLPKRKAIQSSDDNARARSARLRVLRWL